MVARTGKFVQVSSFMAAAGRIAPGACLVAQQSPENEEMPLFKTEGGGKLAATALNYDDEFLPMFLTQDGSSSTMVQALQYGWRIPGVFKDLSLTNTSAMAKFMECMSAGRVAHKPPTVWVLLANK